MKQTKDRRDRVARCKRDFPTAAMAVSHENVVRGLFEKRREVRVRLVTIPLQDFCNGSATIIS